MKKIRVYKDFNALPSSALQLFASTKSHSHVFANLAWLKNLHETACPANSGLRIYCLEAEQYAGDAMTAELGSSSSTAALAMWATKRSHFGFIINELTSLSNFYTSLYSVICVINAKCQSNLMQAFTTEFKTEKPRWDVINFHPLDPLDPQFDLLTSALRQSKMAVQTYFCFGNWYLDVRGRTYQNYFDGLPSKLKNTILRKSSQLIKAQRLQISIVQQGDALTKALHDYAAVYEASWKTSEAHADFIPDLIKLASIEGWLRLGIAYIDGQPAAAQIWLVHNHVASIYKLAYDEQYAKLSIGSILTAHVMQHVIDIDKVKEVDYLTGDEAYKQDWMSNRRERWGIRAFNLSTLAGCVLAGRHILGRHVKHKLKSLLTQSKNTT